MAAGDLIKSLRSEHMASWKVGSGAAMSVANNFGAVTTTVPYFLSLVDAVHRVVGPYPLQTISSLVTRATSNYVPEWNPHMPRGAAPVKPAPMPTAAATTGTGIPRKVVYMPSCVTRMMGPSLSDTERGSVHEKLMSIFDKVRLILPRACARRSLTALAPVDLDETSTSRFRFPTLLEPSQRLQRLQPPAQPPELLSRSLCNRSAAACTMRRSLALPFVPPGFRSGLHGQCPSLSGFVSGVEQRHYQQYQGLTALQSGMA
jgi:hypothetical protein